MRVVFDGKVLVCATGNSMFALYNRLLRLSAGLHDVSHVFKWPDIPYHIQSMPRLQTGLLLCECLHDNVPLMLAWILH